MHYAESVDRLRALLDVPGLLVGLGIGSAVLFFGTLIAVPTIVVSLPPDYFIGPRRPARSRPNRSALAGARTVLRNLLGVVFVFAGVMMLVLPGQGILTLLVGLALVDFPGKRSFEKRLAGQRHVRKSLQWLRERAGREPLRFDEVGAPSTTDPE